MKLVSQVLVLAGITAICCIVVGKHTLATTASINVTPTEIAQNALTTNQKILEVTLSEQATVKLADGSPFTGKLTSFTPDALTISVRDFHQRFALDEIQEIEFDDETLEIDLNERRGEGPPIRLRGWPIPIEDVPVDALAIVRGSNVAKLTLDTVLSNEEFNKLSSDPEKNYAVTKIEFESTAMMEVTIKQFD